MIGTADWHRAVPKGIADNLVFRKRLLQQCQDPEQRAVVMEMCRQDILFYINAFVWQKNPQKEGIYAVAPFITRPYQEQALIGVPPRPGILWCYENRKSAVIAKSRKMGATWLFLIVQDWLCLFHPFIETLNISRSADAVDSKSPNSLFWKIRFMHAHLPEWMTEGITEEKMHFSYRQTDSYISGEASTGRAGVGGRAALIFVDEFTKIKEDKAVRERTANTADCRFFNSTHEGTDTEFFALTQTPEFVQITMHWSENEEMNQGLYRYDKDRGQIEVLDPTYQYPPEFQFQYTEAPLGGLYPGLRSPEYDRMCVQIGSARGVAMEMDIDPSGSVSQFFNALTIRNLRASYAMGPLWEGDLEYDPDSGRPITLIQREGGLLKLWMTPKSLTELPAGKYTLGADVSTGSGATNSCLSGINAATGEKILEYAAADIPPERFAPLCCALGWLLKDEYDSPAWFAWEHAGPGQAFGGIVVGLNYPNIYCREGHQTLAGGKVSQVPGWHCNNNTKRLLLDEYRMDLEGRHVINHSDIALKECLGYRYEGNDITHPQDTTKDDPTGARINHGDRVIADALANMLRRKSGVAVHKVKLAQSTEPPEGSLAWRRMYRKTAEALTSKWR